MRNRLVILLGAAALALGACAQLKPMESAQKLMGGPQSAVQDTFGKPTETYQLPNGTSRWIYSHQPLGYDVYAADFDANGNLVNFRQMLTEQEVYAAKTGVWTKRDVAEHFGMPKEPIQYYPLMKREAWSYRMYVGAYQPAHFSAYFDDRGVLDRTMIIVDPLGGDGKDRAK